MSEQMRILVIEDDEQLCADYARRLKREGYIVDKAVNLEAALTSLSKRTYHVVIVDIGLGGSEDTQDMNVDGLEVLNHLRTQDEGTAALVVSGKPGTQLAADTVQEYQAVHYLAKSSIEIHGSTKLLEEVEKASATSKIKLYGKHDSILALLSGKTGEDLWVSCCLERLKPAETFTGLKQFMEGFFRPFLPLLPLKGHTEILEFVGETKLLQGAFWSKATAESIAAFVTTDAENCKTLMETAGIMWKDSDMICDYRKANLVGYMFRDLSRQQSDYANEISKVG